MKSIFFHSRWYLMCLLFFGYTQSFAQLSQNQEGSPAQCTQKLKLISDKMMFTQNRQEKPVKVDIIIDPLSSTIKTILQEPGQKVPSERIYQIKNMNCTVNDNFTFGRVIYSVASNNPDGSFSSGEFLLEATKRGLFFSNTIDPPQDKAIIPITKFEKL
ncbi:hypothetical protein [Chryseobacterium jejuense]|uniref:Gliding motility-associated protein GldM C-terminal domain-containing protein n=1 Tax=Chryseobacterium jejuense TaxID=445960 RepID=A0A2X2X3R9_CHRJE|nr:hypothetical protein [Chryseobacterium jejuense]SDI64611.1 hypothetical protein SAMN05421542_1593 [Chryseobacterium jejuense]SQB47324.1 Uncharacterised protein [Chryseobacterium jejuense]